MFKKDRYINNWSKRCFKLVVILLIVGLSSPACGVIESDDFSLNRKWTGDYDAMLERRGLRVLTPYNKTFYFLDGGTEKGLAYQGIKGFEKFINKRHKTKNLKIHMVIIPTERSLLLKRLAEGMGDIAIGNLTITDERLKSVNFSDPFLTGVKEVVVTGKNVPDLKNSFDLAGREIYVRKESSYYENLLKLNEVLLSVGKKPVKITLADGHLEDEDLLEMLDAGVVPMLIVDNHKAEFWVKILKNIKLHPDAFVHSDGNIAWAFRKNSPKLNEVINAFVKKNKKGTLHGNMIFNQYLNTLSPPW